MEKIKSLFLALGATRTEKDGSVVSFLLKGIRVDFCRPLSDKAALRYRVKNTRKFLEMTGVKHEHKEI